jgi:hypothetical protein
MADLDLDMFDDTEALPEPRTYRITGEMNINAAVKALVGRNGEAAEGLCLSLKTLPKPRQVGLVLGLDSREMYETNIARVWRMSEKDPRRFLLVLRADQFGFLPDLKGTLKKVGDGDFKSADFDWDGVEQKVTARETELKDVIGEL